MVFWMRTYITKPIQSLQNAALPRHAASTVFPPDLPCHGLENATRRRIERLYARFQIKTG